MEENTEHEIETVFYIEFYGNYGCTGFDKSIFASGVREL